MRNENRRKFSNFKNRPAGPPLRRSGKRSESQRRPPRNMAPLHYAPSGFPAEGFDDSPNRPEVPGGDFVYGRRPVLEAIDAAKRPIHKIWVVRGTGGGPVERILGLARERGIPIEWTQWQWLDKTAKGGHHQGIAAQVSATEYQELEDFLAKLPPTADAVLVALDEIQDPQNLGAILRSAAFFGVAAAIVPRWRSAPVSDAAMRVASGAVEYLPVIRVRNLSDALLQLKDAAFQIIGADADGAPLSTVRPSGRSVLVMGSEGPGLRRLVSERCEKLVGIPRRGPLDSLNVGAAAAIFLYEFFRNKPKTTGVER